MKLKKTLIIILILALVSLVISIDISNQYQKSEKARELDTAAIGHVKISGKMLSVDLALTPEAQEQGLSGRNNLADDKGMLFVFTKPDIYPFWMPDMKFPIDIIWLDSNLNVVYIKADAEPSSYPETFSPSSDAKYVLEVVSGFSQNNSLKIGDSVEFLP